MKNRIESDLLLARKNKETDIVKKNLLSVIKGDIQTMEKNNNSELSNEEIVTLITKHKKSIEINISSGLGDLDVLREELSIVKSYLPQEMSEDEIRLKIENLIKSGINTMPMIMKEFSTIPCDKKLVSTIVKELL